MSAGVIPTSKHGRRSQAWCEECQDGVNSSTKRANVWAIQHNAKHHKEVRDDGKD